MFLVLAIIFIIIFLYFLIVSIHGGVVAVLRSIHRPLYHCTTARLFLSAVLYVTYVLLMNLKLRALHVHLKGGK